MPIPPALLQFARQMRKNQTNAEQFLWRLLRNRNFCGYKFRRQYPIGGYIIDFFCDEANLAIELDGGGHAGIAQQAYDEERSRTLSGAGIRIIRFWNNAVLNNTDNVLEKIYVELITIRMNPPHPAAGHLLPQGEGTDSVFDAGEGIHAE